MELGEFGIEHNDLRAGLKRYLSREYGGIF
jgi:hypothetical protein